MECGIGRKGTAEGALIVLEMITMDYSKGTKKKTYKELA